MAAESQSFDWFNDTPSDSSSSSFSLSSSSDDDACDHLKIAADVHIFERDGNMIIVVGKKKCSNAKCDHGSDKAPNQKKIQVHSTVIAPASAAFGLLLYSPRGAIEGPQQVNWVVRLPDDDPQSMLTIINILYQRFPISDEDIHMDLERLLKLTILADKYNLTSHLATWSVQWIQEMKPYWFNRKFIKKSTEDLESLLFIFWVLGDEPMYSYVILQLAFHSEIDANKRLADPVGGLCFANELRDIPIPPKAIDEIKHVRVQALMLIRKDMKKTLEDHLHGNKNKTDKCTRMDGRDDYGWRRSVLRLFVEMLQNEHLWPVPYADELGASPKTLVELFRVHPNIPRFVHHFGDRACDAEGPFWEHIDKILRQEVRLTLGERTKQGLKRYAERSGIVHYLNLANDELDATKGNWTIKEILEVQEALSLTAPVASHE